MSILNEIFFCVLHYRRQDRPINIVNDKICGRHFKNGIKSNGSTIISWNKKKVFDFSSPEKRCC